MHFSLPHAKHLLLARPGALPLDLSTQTQEECEAPFSSTSSSSSLSSVPGSPSRLQQIAALQDAMDIIANKRTFTNSVGEEVQM
eukprot:682186-Hanusia_phi.AAC.1